MFPRELIPSYTHVWISDTIEHFYSEQILSQLHLNHSKPLSTAILMIQRNRTTVLNVIKILSITELLSPPWAQNIQWKFQNIIFSGSILDGLPPIEQTWFISYRTDIHHCSLMNYCRIVWTAEVMNCLSISLYIKLHFISHVQ